MSSSLARSLSGSIADGEVAFGQGTSITGDSLLSYSDNIAFQTLTINNVDLQYDVNSGDFVIDNPTRFVFSVIINHHIAVNANNANNVSSLPTPPILGMISLVSDGTAGLNWGDIVTGGHSTKYLVWYNGTNWTVLGK